MTKLTINQVLQRLARRAERLDAATLQKTYATTGGLDQRLVNIDNRIILGRRGTGKTHALNWISETTKSKSSIATTLDLRKMGSNGSIYSDSSFSMDERATTLLRDFVSSLTESIWESITKKDAPKIPSSFEDGLEDLSNSVKQITVISEIEQLSNQDRIDISKSGARFKFGLEGIGLKAEGSGATEESQKSSTLVKGTAKLSINFGEVSTALKKMTQSITGRFWILIDEWSDIPVELQPILSHFIKATMLPIDKITIVIAAIEQRTNFRSVSEGKSIGLELGSDIFADINLDDYLVFENNPEVASDFFSELLFKHYDAIDVEKSVELKSRDEFINNTFTQKNAFEELVRASEGVPRDAINIIQIAASKAGTDKISVPIVRQAARDWYERDKSTYLDTNPKARELLHWIINEVIKERNARAFMIRADHHDETLERLFDERILHIAKKSYSSRDEAGLRYRVLKLDYGCYVDLMNTAKAPKYFLPDLEYNDGNIVVPEDDYRAIRRAILDMGSFESKL